MGAARPWQIILFVLALIGLSGGLFYSCRGGVDLADSVLMVDVQTGDRFRFDTGGKRGVGIPAKNPDTGERTLLPIVKIDDAWFLADHYRDALETIEGEHAAINPATFEATISEQSVRSGR